MWPESERSRVRQRWCGGTESSLFSFRAGDRDEKMVNEIIFDNYRSIPKKALSHCVMATMETEENVPDTVLGSVTVRGIRASDSAEAGIASSLAAADAGEGKGDDGSGDECEVGAGVDVVNVATGEVVPLNKHAHHDHAHHDHEGCGTFRPLFLAPPRAVCVLCVGLVVCARARVALRSRSFRSIN